VNTVGNDTLRLEIEYILPSTILVSDNSMSAPLPVGPTVPIIALLPLKQINQDAAPLRVAEAAVVEMESSTILAK
jgi:hypothetical protein